MTPEHAHEVLEAVTFGTERIHSKEAAKLMKAIGILKNRCTIVQMADVTVAMLIEIGVTIYDDLRYRYLTRAMLERCNNNVP